MESGEFRCLSTLSDARLQIGLNELLAAGYRIESRIIAHLAEVEQRKLHLKEGCPSLFDFCTRRLRLSNSEAFHRITAARIARQFPIVFSLLEQRQLHLTAVCLLRDYLTPENHRELLVQASHKTKFQVQELLARRFPRPDVESRVRKLPAPRSAIAIVANSKNTTIAPDANSPDRDLTLQNPRLGSVPALSAGPSPAQAAPFLSTPSPSTRSPSAPVLPEPARPQHTTAAPPRGAPVSNLVEPLSEARYRIQLNASAALKEKLDRLRALTSHSNPSGDLAVIIERALDLAIEQVEKQRFAKSKRPRVRSQPSVQAHFDRPRPAVTASAGAGTASTRQRAHVPNAVLREIAERDGMQCSYRGANGCRCTTQAFLQVHHERPWAKNGAETADNLRLLCAAHNQLLAERDFGARHVEFRRSERRRQRVSEPDTHGT